jgi:hypothetical protein
MSAICESVPKWNKVRLLLCRTTASNSKTPAKQITNKKSPLGLLICRRAKIYRASLAGSAFDNSNKLRLPKARPRLIKEIFLRIEIKNRENQSKTEPNNSKNTNSERFCGWLIICLLMGI